MCAVTGNLPAQQDAAVIGNPVSVIHDPICEIDWPAQSFRNSAARRSPLSTVSEPHESGALSPAPQKRSWVGRHLPERNELKAPFGELVVTGRRQMAAGAEATDSDQKSREEARSRRVLSSTAQTAGLSPPVSPLGMSREVVVGRKLHRRDPGNGRPVWDEPCEFVPTPSWATPSQYA